MSRELNIIDEMNDPFGSVLFRELDNLDLITINLPKKVRIDLLPESSTKLEYIIYTNRITDDYMVNNIKIPRDKSQYVLLETILVQR